MSETTRYETYTPGRPGPEEPRAEAGGRSSYSCGTPSGLTRAALVCVVIWAMSGFGYFWPIWVILPAVLMGGFRPSGPRPIKNEAAAGVSGHLRQRFRR